MCLRALGVCVCVCERGWRQRRWLDERMQRVCNSVHVLCAPDGVSVVGTIVVGATVGVVGVGVGVGGAVGANVGDDVVGASVGVAAAHTVASSSLQRRGLLPPTARYPEYPYRPVWCPHGYSVVPARTARGRACFLGYR